MRRCLLLLLLLLASRSSLDAQPFTFPPPFEPPATTPKYVLTVTKGGSGSGTIHPNEPAGFVPVRENPFSSANESNWTYFVQNPNWTSFVNDQSDAPLSPSGAFRRHYTQGTTAECDGGSVWTGLPTGKRAIYIHFAYKVSPNTVYHPNGFSKLIRIQHFENTTEVPTVGPQLDGIAAQDGVRPFMGTQFALGPIAHYANVNDFRVDRGKWYQWEILLDLGSPGNADGTIRWWVNNVLVGNYTNHQFLRSTATNYYWHSVGAFFCISPDISPVNMDGWYDHIYISLKDAL